VAINSRPAGALPPLLLDDDEAIAVALGLRFAARGGLPGLEDQALAALAKIEQVLPLRLRVRVEAVDSSTVRVTPQGSPASRLNPNLLVAMAQACRGGERMRFVYVNSTGLESERHVEPYRLVFAARRWYLVAFDRDREAWRTFRIDRVKDAQLTGLRFQHQDLPDAAALVAEGLAVSVYRLEAKVVLKVKPAEAANLVSPTVGLLSPHRRGTLLRIGADDLPWIARYLAGMPCRFEVLEPAELKEAVRAHAARLAADTA